VEAELALSHTSSPGPQPDQPRAVGSSPQPSFRSVLAQGGNATDPADATGPAAAAELTQPPCFADLNLDQVVAALTAGREQYRLQQFLYAPLHDVDAVAYRQEVIRDLEQPALLATIRAFAEAMIEMRRHLAEAAKRRYAQQREAWFLDAVLVYSDAVEALAAALACHGLSSRGLRGLRHHLDSYASSERFRSQAAEARALKARFREIRYAVRIDGARVTVSAYDGDADYSAEIERTFARFRTGAVDSYLVALTDEHDMNHVEAEILAGVTELHPEAFAARADYCTRSADFVDQTLARFDREVQLYVAYLELIDRLRGAGLGFCYPQVSESSKQISCTRSFDLALAVKLLGEHRPVVRNDFELRDRERMLIVTGANNGGKTTFARMFGQLHWLASLGLPVPGARAQLFLPDQIFTHFEREEDLATLRGKFDDELVRVHEILVRATSDSLVVMNESFGSTTLNDALYVGTEVLTRLLRLGCIGVYVTFVDELSSLSAATVSIVTETVAARPAERTFRLVRKPADGVAHAWALAERYGLTYDQLIDRID
jgi:DNA mismatch repair protein MutS